jgi:hypothetical protein
VDKDDNVWAVDEGTNVIQKFSPDGKLLMVLGGGDRRADDHAARRRPASGANRPYAFTGRPTSRGIRRATSSSLMATVIRAS